MSKKRYQSEEIDSILRQVDVMTSQGQSVAQAIRSIGVTEVTYYRWRQENARLRKAVSVLTLEKLVLKEAASGN